MCGITGYIFTGNNSVTDTHVVRCMLTEQKHRGPDDSGIMAFSLREQAAKEYGHHQTQPVDGSFEGILGFNRLSILDLSKNGHQPMCSPDGKVILTLNGEIYNAFDLKPGLEKDGYHFKSTTDTEVVLYLYLKYGFHKMVEKLNGMFAIAVVDLRDSKLYITRDRFGIKPMYYYHQDGVLAFSSEIKSFYSLPQFRAVMDESMLDEYMVFRNNLHHTLIKGVHRMEPGFYYTYTHGNGLSAAKYFDINDYQRQPQQSTTMESAQQKLQEVLKQSVSSQLMSDVKLGCQLSGGIDSSLVTWLAREIKQDDLLESVSIVFNDKNFSEKPYIDKVAQQLNIVSHQFLLDPGYYQQQIQKATWHFEQPVNHPNTIGIFLLAQKAKDYVTVLLSGEGADEVFGGYGRFYAVMYPYTNRKFWAGLKNAGAGAATYLKNYTDPFFRANINVASMSPAMAAGLRPGFSYDHATKGRREIYRRLTGSVFDRQVKYDIATYLPDLLTRQDKMSMAHSIENRVPFLDNDVVAHSFSIPQNFLIKRKAAESSNTEKYLLKKLCAAVFGNDFAFRDKMGFGIPLRQFMSAPAFNEYLKEQVLPGLKKRGLFDGALIERWVTGLQHISAPELDALWVMVSLELWMQQFIDR
jgi:asparagine synthase (glutamine-hydrolysing)